MLSSTRRAAAHSTAAQTPCAAGGDPRYLRQTCEQRLKNLGIEALDVFCMSRVDPKMPIEDSVGGMAELVKEGKTRFISLSESSAESLKRGSAVHPVVSLQMEYSLFSRDAEAAWVGGALAGGVDGGPTIAVASLSPRLRSAARFWRDRGMQHVVLERLGRERGNARSEAAQ
jgi:aryl-alcohol dehydrogenase-like predicted oxidoreductase